MTLPGDGSCDGGLRRARVPFARLAFPVLLAACGDPAHLADPATPPAAPPDPAQLGSRAMPSLPSREIQGQGLAIPAGTWYLAAPGGGDVTRLRLTLDCDARATRCTGLIADEAAGVPDTVDRVRWDEKKGALVFRRVGPGAWSWFHVSVADGVLAGRFAETSDDAEPADPAAYPHHVTGWKAEVFDRDLAPRVYELVLDGEAYARLRIDRAAGKPNQYEGRFKVYASQKLKASAEGDEYDVQISSWDGRYLLFTQRDPDFTRVYNLTVTGRTIAGSWIQLGAADEHAITGVRAEVLSHGFAQRTALQRAFYQARVRRALQLLVMAKNPAPVESAVRVLTENAPPLASRRPAPDRDDAIPGHPANDYRRTELAFDVAIADPYHPGEKISRTIHGWLATPAGPPPAGGWPAVVALNGHEGSALGTFDPDTEFYWYGDAFARRGHVVLAIDVGHRPLYDRGGLYDGALAGDDPSRGNGTHPAIESPGLDSDFEETGERIFDALRALDHLRGRSDVNPARVGLVGLSMGGEIATWTAAMDPRAAFVVAAGWSPDLGVLDQHGSHPCWKWRGGDIREYLDASDLHALIAPRPLVVETGKLDWSFAWIQTPWASDKQVMRRSRVAWFDAPMRVLHYLHYDVHHFHAGGPLVNAAAEPDVRQPLLTVPDLTGSLGWQRDGATVDAQTDLFSLLTRMVP